jgi:hypothetical protein
MAREQRVSVGIYAKNKADAAIKQVDAGFKKLGNTIKTSALAQIASFAAVALAIRKMGAAFSDALRAAQVQQDAINKLDQALKPLGATAAGVSQRLQEQASALQAVTTAGDETIIQGQALIASFTRNEEEIKAATEAALNLSAATGQDLASAFLLLGKAAAGETSTLSRYGIILDEAIPKSERFSAALDQINQRFGGQAQAAAETYAGAIKQLGNVMGDAAEKMAEPITESERLRDAIHDFTAEVKESESALSGAGALWEALATALYKLGAGTLHVTRIFSQEFEEGMRGANIELRKVGDSVEDLEKGLRKYAAQSGFTGTQTRDLINNFNTMVAVTGDAVKAFDSLIDSEERYRRIQADVNAGAADFKSFLSEIGTTLESQVTAQVEKYQIQLQFAKDNARELNLTHEDLIRIEADTAKAISELRGELDDNTKAFGDNSKAVDKHRVALDADSDATERNTRSTNENTQAQERNGRIREEGIHGSRLGSSPTDPLFAGLSGTRGTFTTYRKGYVRPDGTVVYLS